VAANGGVVLHRGGKRPQRTSLVTHLPARFIHVHHCGMDEQLADRLEFRLPMLRQLPQQGIGLGPLQRQVAKELQYLAGLGQRDADHVHQKCQHDEDFHAVFTTRRDAGDASFVTVRPTKDAIADEHRMAVFQPPDGPLADEAAVFLPDIEWIYVLDAFRVGKFEMGGTPTARLLLALSFAAPLFLGFDAVPRRVRRCRRRFTENLRFILSKPLLQAIDFGLQPLNRPLLFVKQIQQLLDRQPSVLKLRSRLPGIHALCLTHLPEITNINFVGLSGLEWVGLDW